MLVVMLIFQLDGPRAAPEEVVCLRAPEEPGADVVIVGDMAEAPAIALRGGGRVVVDIGLAHGRERPQHVRVVVQSLSLQLRYLVLQLHRLVVDLGGVRALESVGGRVLLGLLLHRVIVVLLLICGSPISL